MVKSTVEKLQSPLNPWQDWPLALTDCLIAVLVPPMLIGVAGLKVISAGLTELGLGSEQLLQGQRLPTLNIHPPAAAQPDSSPPG